MTCFLNPVECVSREGKALSSQRVKTMNVMAQAHKATKLLILSMSAEGQVQVKAEKPYGRMFAINLKRFHKEFKTMQAQKTIKLALIASTLEADKDAEWFGVEGTAIDSEGNQVHIGYSGSSIAVQAEADWYFNHTNGFTNINLYACVWNSENIKESLKIIR